MKVFIKRFFPFLLTFAAGLLIASFFVTVSAPKFQFNKRSGKYKKFRELRNENDRLRRENENLKRELADRETIDSDDFILLDVPPPPMPPMPPAPPAPPKPPVAPGR